MKIKVEPSPTPCSRYLEDDRYEDCLVCGWPEGPHSYEQVEYNGVWFLVLPKIELDWILENED